jgi:hypothetical protein
LGSPERKQRNNLYLQDFRGARPALAGENACKRDNAKRRKEFHLGFNNAKQGGANLTIP